MPAPSHRSAVLLPCELPSASAARRALTALCRDAGVDPGAAESAELLVSEVVTNAVLHGRSDVRLQLCAAPGLLRVEVGDDNSRRPRAQAADPGALDGRGLAILEVVADRWGVLDAPVGKVVWFELDL